MGNAFRNRRRTALVAAVSGMLFTLAGCAPLPEVKPPDPKQLVLDIEGQLRQFKGFTPQQVLAAAEEVLRKHEPEAKFVRSADTLKMESHHVGSIAIVWWQREERWAVHAREEDQVTVASVAMDERSASMCLVCGMGGFSAGQLPSKAKPRLFGTVGPVDIDYGMFWHRVQSILTGAPWPECLNVWEMTFSPRYFEPLCSNRTRDRYEAK